VIFSRVGKYGEPQGDSIIELHGGSLPIQFQNEGGFLVRLLRFPTRDDAEFHSATQLPGNNSAKLVELGSLNTVGFDSQFRV
jgi:hypothetical protein